MAKVELSLCANPFSYSICSSDCSDCLANMSINRFDSSSQLEETKQLLKEAAEALSELIPGSECGGYWYFPLMRKLIASGYLDRETLGWYLPDV